MPKAKEAQVIAMPKRDNDAPEMDLTTPWGALGFASERDMLIDDLRTLDARVKAPTTTATAVAALSKRKQEIFEQIKLLDAGGDELDEILDDSEDEAWDAGG
ncbi:hypothetical protein [Mycolicibacterium peregrinum]|uniref:hypothetical protein n=1 Tax=Mycolicibacterium peregrinum TaxID=43304 RepID=UPI003AAE251F